MQFFSAKKTCPSDYIDQGAKKRCNFDFVRNILQKLIVLKAYQKSTWVRSAKVFNFEHFSPFLRS